MRKNTSYLDSLNDGRQRRSRTSLDDLDRTLRGLEERIGAGGGSLSGRPRDMADRFKELAGDPQAAARPLKGGSTRERAPANASSSFKTLAQDIEIARIQEKNVAAVETIAAELKSLRHELQNKMTSGLHREFDALRADIAETYRAAQSGNPARELAEDIARLSENVRALGQKSDDSGIHMLRLEIEEIKKALGTVAREETVQQFNDRWDQMDQKWDSLSPSDSSNYAVEPEFQALAQRLEDISHAIDSLPASLPLNSLDDKLQVLASAVEHLTKNHDPVSSQFVDMIEQRLDEISRAIVASSVSVQAAAPNIEHFERIEARISAVARQIEELLETQTSDDLMERINLLSERIDGTGAGSDAVDNLTAQIAALSAKLDSDTSANGSEPLLRDLEQRYEHLVSMLERQHDATEQQGQALLKDLEHRLDSVVGAGAGDGYASDDHSAIIKTIDQRFNELAERFSASPDRDADNLTMRNLTARLEDISSHLERTGGAGSGLDRDLIRNLESQIAGLAQHLERPDSVIPEYEDVRPRISEMENTIAGTREHIIEAARAAAAEAIRSLPEGSGNDQSVRALTEDLKSLETLTRNSDERNARTFEAIHHTLLKIVDRLGTLETGAPATDGHQPAAGSRVLDEHETLSIDPGNGAALERPVETPAAMRARSARQQSSPAEAAEAAARAAESDIDSAERPDQGDGSRSSMLGGLARALKGKGEAKTTAEFQMDERVSVEPAGQGPNFELDAPNANTPLEPGSGTPDLGSIMARVAEERTGSSKTESQDAAKSDFIAAARRAAQAAAAEAETNRFNMETRGSSGRFKGFELLQKKRKPILVGASVLLIALAGMQLGKAFLSSDDVAVVADTSAIRDGTQPGKPTPEEPIDGQVAEVAPMEEGSARIVVPKKPEPAEASPGEVMAPEPTEAKTASETMAAPQVMEPAEVTPALSATIAKIPIEAGPVALREAAESGDAKALYEVGNRYADGRGVKSDLKEAAKWYRAAADLGFAPAQYRVGNFFEKGLGLERDPAKAMTWYQLAAEQGNASAMHNLAVLHAMGANGQPDNESAAMWFEKAAELGVKDSQFNLGILSAKGVGVPQSLEESYKWFALAAKTGDKDAASKRDEIANALRPEQLAIARAATDLWKAKPLDSDANTVEVPAAWQEDGGKTASVDMQKAVTNIQLLLNKLGYDAGPADGIMGAKTKDAIASFQNENGMPATGEVDEALVKALLAKNE